MGPKDNVGTLSYVESSKTIHSADTDEAADVGHLTLYTCPEYIDEECEGPFSDSYTWIKVCAGAFISTSRSDRCFESA